MVSIFQAEGLTKRFGDHVLFEGLSFSVHEREKLAIIARNGTGKSTLLNILTGKDVADTGSLTRRQGLRISYLLQEPELKDTLPVIDQVLSGGDERTRAVHDYELAIARNDAAEIARLAAFIDNHQAWDLENQVHQVLTRLELTDPGQLVGQLSGGQRKRVALASALVSNPDLLILDEPTNHLDLAMIEWLESYLAEMSSALLLVTHDRYFLDNICTGILEIDHKVLHSYQGNYSYYLEKKSEFESARQATVDKAQNLMRTELDWIRRQPKARGTKAKYRVDAFEHLKEKASGGKSQKDVSINVNTSRIGSKILEVKNLQFSYPGKPIVSNFTYLFASGDKIGLVGANGAGKSTLLNLFTGVLSPQTGSVDKGSTVTFGYYRQEGIRFDDNKKVIDAVRDIAEVVRMADGSQLGVSQFLTSFLFPPPKQQQLIAKLSGGEKRRLYLATVLMQSPNFLILDEPTNDLDIATLQILEDYLINFPGCAVIVSHDRFFMNKIVGHVFAIEQDGSIKDIPGNYNDYITYRDEKQRKLQEAKPAAKAPQTATIKETSAKKAGFREKNEHAQLESQIAGLEAEKSKLEQTLASSTLSLDELTAASLRISRVIEEIDAASLRWLELDELIHKP